MRIALGMLLSSTLFMSNEAMAAPVSYTGGSYAQNFDGMGASGFGSIPGRGPFDVNGAYGTITNTLMDGWTMSNPEPPAGGSSVAVEVRAQDGSQSGSAGRGVVSFGTTGSGERALGALSTSNQINRFGVTLTNNSAVTYGEFTLAFTGEQWRRGDDDTPTPNSLFYAYRITSNSADTVDTAGFTSISTFAAPINTGLINVALNGNDPANQTPKLHTISGINWAPGSNLIIRWAAQDLTGQDDGLAIDNLNFSANVPEPLSIVYAIMAAIGVTCVRRQR
jgi:hypothetical protein